jgi:hypothetical protein
LLTLSLGPFAVSQRPTHVHDLHNYHLTEKDQATIVQVGDRFRVVKRPSGQVLLDVDPKTFKISIPSAPETVHLHGYEAPWRLKHIVPWTLAVRDKTDSNPGEVFLLEDGGPSRSIFRVDPSCQKDLSLYTFFLDKDHIVVPECGSHAFLIVSPEGKRLYEVPEGESDEILRGQSVFAVTSTVALFKDIVALFDEPSGRRTRVFCMSNGKQLFDKKWSNDDPPSSPIAFSPSEDIVALFDYKKVEFYPLDRAGCTIR